MKPVDLGNMAALLTGAAACRAPSRKRATLSPLGVADLRARKATYQREWRRRNPGKDTAQRRKWVGENRDKYNAYMRNYMREAYQRKKEATQ